MDEEIMIANETFMFSNYTEIDLWDEDITVKLSSNIFRIDIIVLSVIFALALVGNLVVASILLWRRFGPCRSPKCYESSLSYTSVRFRLTNIQWFILLLSFADICVAFFTILPQLIWEVTGSFNGNDFVCRTVKYLQVVAMYLSTNTMVVLAIDRYIAVCHPSFSVHRERKRIAILISIAWSLAFIFGLPQIFIFSLKQLHPGYSQCWGVFDPEWTVKLYVTCFAIIILLAPLIILIFCYSRICFVIWGHAGNNAVCCPTFNSSQQGERIRTVYFRSSLNSGERINIMDEQIHGTIQKKISAAKLKTLKLSIAIILFYIICWAPFIIVQLWTVYDEMAPINLTIIVVILRMANLSSCVNPWIYLVFSALWRKSFAEVDSSSNTALSNTDFDNSRENTE